MAPQAFRDRSDAGRRLAERLESLEGEQPVVIALPRGGVPVAYEVAEGLDAPLDVMAVRKLGAPSHRELGMGALAEDGVRVLNDEVVEALSIGDDQIEATVTREQEELERRRERYRGDLPPVPVEGRTAILIDDGIATGFTAIAAARTLRGRGAQRIVLAVPVAPRDAEARLRDEVDELICLEAPTELVAVGIHYQRFDQTTDDEVVELLGRVRERHGPRAA